jgi:hypothetical protein
MNTGTIESSRKTRFPFALTLLAVLALAGWAPAQESVPDDVDDEIGVLIGDLAKPGLPRRNACALLAYTPKYRGKAKRAIPALLKIVEPGGNDAVLGVSTKSGTGPVTDDPEKITVLQYPEGLDLSFAAIQALKANGFDAKTAVHRLTVALAMDLSALRFDFLSSEIPHKGDRDYPNPDNSPSCRWGNLLIVEISKLLGSAGAEAKEAVPVLLKVVRKQDLRQLAQVPQVAQIERKAQPPRDSPQALGEGLPAQAAAVAAIEREAGHDVQVMPLVFTQTARVAAIEALGAIGSEVALEPLIRVRTYEAEPTIKEAAGRAIAAIRRAPSARPKAAAPATEGEDTVKSNEAPGPKPRAEGEPKPLQSVIKAHLRDLGDADPQVRREAAEALGGLGVLGRSATPGLRKALRDKDETVREAAAKALERIFAEDYNQ